MTKVASLQPGTKFKLSGEYYVRCSPLIYRRPIGSDRKGKQVLAINLKTGKELIENRTL